MEEGKGILLLTAVVAAVLLALFVWLVGRDSMDYSGSANTLDTKWNEDEQWARKQRRTVGTRHCQDTRPRNCDRPPLIRTMRPRIQMVPRPRVVVIDRTNPVTPWTS